MTDPSVMSLVELARDLRSQLGAAVDMTAAFVMMNPDVQSADLADAIQASFAPVIHAADELEREAASRLAEETREDDLGLSIDMLDADRLRQYAQNLLTYGPDITNWASVQHVVAKLQTLATGIEKAVRDIGVLRQSTPPASPAATSIPATSVTLSREQIERALALVSAQYSGQASLDLADSLAKMDVYNIGCALRVLIEAASRVSAAERPAPTCQWTEDDDGVWHTDCGEAWQFTTDGPIENRQRYCGYCGKSLSAAPRSVVAPEKDRP